MSTPYTNLIAAINLFFILRRSIANNYFLAAIKLEIGLLLLVAKLVIDRILDA
jgi:hypothetical protein